MDESHYKQVYDRQKYGPFAFPFCQPSDFGLPNGQCMSRMWKPARLRAIGSDGKPTGCGMVLLFVLLAFVVGLMAK